MQLLPPSQGWKELSEIVLSFDVAVKKTFKPFSWPVYGYPCQSTGSSQFKLSRLWLFSSLSHHHTAAGYKLHAVKSGSHQTSFLFAGRSCSCRSNVLAWIIKDTQTANQPSWYTHFMIGMVACGNIFSQVIFCKILCQNTSLSSDIDSKSTVCSSFLLRFWAMACFRCRITSADVWHIAKPFEKIHSMKQFNVSMICCLQLQVGASSFLHVVELVVSFDIKVKVSFLIIIRCFSEYL